MITCLFYNKPIISRVLTVKLLYWNNGIHIAEGTYVIICPATCGKFYCNKKAENKQETRRLNYAII